MRGYCSKFRMSSLIVAAILAVVCPTAEVAYGQGNWTVLAPVPAPTEGMSVSVIGNRIVAAYGFSGGDTNLTRLYDISSDTWTFGTPAPLPVRSEQSYGDSTHGGFVYVIGGRPVGLVGNRLERYDPASDTWTTLSPMPTARAGAAKAVIDNGIYVIGGRQTDSPCSGLPLPTVERYDIDTDTWSARAPLPGPPRSDLAAVAHGGKIYVFGGCTSPIGFLNDVDVYDPVTDTWSTAPADMPTARASLVAGKVGTSVYAMGGYAGGGPLNTNEVYRIPKDSWSTAAAMITGRGEAGAASHGGRVYVVGGALPAFGASINANEVFKPNP